MPPQSTACSPKRSVSVSSGKVVSIIPARPAPMRGAVGERELERLAARVLRDRDDGRRAEALGEEPPDDVARALRRDHEDVVAGRRRDPAVMDVEPVREHERRSVREVRRHLLFVDARLHLVGKEERDELRALDRLGDRADR